MLLIFDWDGTLSDSTGKIVRCVQEAARKLALPVPSEDAARNIIGLSLDRALHELFPSLTGADLKRLVARYSDTFLADDEQTSPFYPGVESVLAELKQRGFRLAVATGKSRRGLDRVLAAHQWQDFFDATRCADETASKPEPLMLQELLDHFGEPAAAAVMVGDTEYDMAMAQAIHMPRAAVSYGAHTIDRLVPYAPVVCIDHFEQFRHWLANAGAPHLLP